MAIEKEDLELFLSFRQQNPQGRNCAILGDCKIYESDIEQFSKLMNFDVVHTFDINGNPTYKIDLNEELPEHFYDKYDWVIDSGTLYCCFDVSTVLKNISNMLKEEGCIIHTANLAGFFGRGFYSLSPAFFKDFYSANNYKILHMATKTRTSRKWNGINPQYTYLSKASKDEILFCEDSSGYIPEIPNDSLIFCFSKRKHKIKFTKPVPEHFIKTNGR